MVDAAAVYIGSMVETCELYPRALRAHLAGAPRRYYCRLGHACTSERPGWRYPTSWISHGGLVAEAWTLFSRAEKVPYSAVLVILTLRRAGQLKSSRCRTSLFERNDGPGREYVKKTKLLPRPLCGEGTWKGTGGGWRRAGGSFPQEMQRPVPS